MPLHPFAEAANRQLMADCPVVADMLSTIGTALYWPAKGILSQSAEAKAKASNHNATVGIATEGAGPMHLASVHRYFADLPPADIYPYAPSPGRPDLRQAWRDKLCRETPSLEGHPVSLPVVTNALTHGLAVVGELFIDRGDSVLIADQHWENYELCWQTRLGAEFVSYPFFTAALGGMNVAALREALAARRGSKLVVSLNFPNNPTGYQPTRAEAAAIVSALTDAAAAGTRLVVVCDDAYHGMFYDAACETESLFGRLARAHENLLAVRIDGGTKEQFVWGLRVGFITFGVKNGTPAAYRALEDKVAGCIRGSLSNISHPAQSILLRALSDPETSAQQAAKVAILKARAEAVAAAAADPAYADCWDVYPFNAGYFMLLRIKGVDAEDLRQHLLEQEGVGVIALSPTDLRVAFSSVEEGQIADLFLRLARGLRSLRGS